jgi:hypothetical protein
MAADLYRDAHVGIRARLSDLEVRIRETEAELTDAFWASLDPLVRERLGQMREAFELARAESFEELARAEQFLASYLEELAGLVASLPTVEEEWRALPEEAPDPPIDRESWLLGVPSASEAKELVRTFRAMVKERDRRAEVVDGRHSCLARFRDRGAPFSLRATAQTNGNGQISEVSMVLVTSVPRAMPRLLVRHESLLQAFGKALGLKHEVEVGEPSFDGLFLIEGTKEAADRLLVPHVRSLLLTLSRFDIPTLEIDPPRRLAQICWRFEPAAKALDAAVRVLASIRETTAEVRFLR